MCLHVFLPRRGGAVAPPSKDRKAMALTPVGAGVLRVVLGEVGEEVPEAPLLEEADQGG